MALEKPFIEGHGLDRPDGFVLYELFHPIDEKHGIAVRQHRHHPGYVIVEQFRHAGSTSGWPAERLAAAVAAGLPDCEHLPPAIAEAADAAKPYCAAAASQQELRC
eukprot:TRINITY_DN7637_c0_g1_i1.p1 TRINITY_DN7637_c0_g1~~TRINITY_DN7637_c0_g1_i1.p1  ORF type:complete len:106 (-),score=10.82 TRINITY_DN7637_c0_g1_i1:2-319(-)